MPKDITDFLECASNEVVLKPGKQAWLKNIPEVGGALEDAQIEFDENKDGSIKATASLYGLSQSVNLKVDGNGELSIDASDAAVVSHFQENINRWTKDVNRWFKHKGKKLAKPKYKPGRRTLTLTKENAGAAATPVPPKDGVKTGGLLPNVPLGEKVGAGALFGLAVIGAIVGLPKDHTTVRNVTDTVAVTPTVAPVASPTTAPVSTAPAKPTIGDACIGVDHVAPGRYSLLQLFFTTDPKSSGAWSAAVASSPTGPLNGTGDVGADGHGEIDVKIFQFGQYGGLAVTGPGGVAVPIGPFASMLPFTVTSQPKACDPSQLRVPSVTPPPAVVTVPPTTAAPATQAVTRQERTTESGGNPWSLLLIPGAAATLGGVLVLDERRRRQLDYAMSHYWNWLGVRTTPPPDPDVPTIVEQPDLPPAEWIDPDPPRPSGDVM
jgi:hypothetical protein